MCGIIYVKRKDNRPAYKSVLKRYSVQKSRGKEGFGYVAIKDGKVVSYKRSPIEHEIIKMLRQEDAPEILFHHRFPTSTPNIEESAHPLMIINEHLTHNYFIAHNGVIRNTDEMKKKHEKMGIRYTTRLEALAKTPLGKEYITGEDWNDSESLAVETALCFDGVTKEIATTGPAAVIGLKLDGDVVKERFFFRNHANPLVYYEDYNLTIIASEGKGETVKIVDVFHLKDGGGFEPMGRFEAPVAYNYSGYGYQNSHSPSWDDRDYEFSHNRTLPQKESSIIQLPASNALSIKEILEVREEVEAMSDDRLWAKYDEVEGYLQEYDADLAVARMMVSANREDASAMDEMITLEMNIKKAGDLHHMLEIEIDRRGAARVTNGLIH